MENIFRHYFLLNEIPVYLVNSNLKKEQLTIILSSNKFNAFEFCCGNSQISSNYFDVTNEETNYHNYETRKRNIDESSV